MRVHVWFRVNGLHVTSRQLRHNTNADLKSGAGANASDLLCTSVGYTVGVAYVSS